MKTLSGRTTCHAHKFNDWKSKKADGHSSVRSVKLFDVQWSDCPVEIEEIVEKMWQDYELGNDHYHLTFKGFDDLKEMMSDEVDFELVKEYLQTKGVKDNDEVIIHWWW